MKNALAIAVVTVLLAMPAAAQSTPVGIWRTFDDQTGRERARVLIEEHGGVLEGRIIGMIDPADAARRCERCTGVRHDKPIIGLTIITGMRADGDHWDGGEIMDPKDGSIYSCTMRLAEAGEKLVVRGFVGVAFLGRSQTWLRSR